MAFSSNPGFLVAGPLVAAPFVGSFLATLAWRLPRGLPILWARSACPQCATPLGPVDLIPIFGWLLRRGHCRSCAAPIPPAYPLTELAALGLAAWAAWTVPTGWPLWAICALGWMLLALALIDARHFLLPDALTLPLMLAGLALGLAGGAHWPVGPAEAAIGAACGYLVLTALGFIYRRLRGRTGLGGGDAKLLAAAGAWTGWIGLPSVVLIAAVAALAWTVADAVARRRRIEAGQPVAFGVFLALGTWLVVLYGPLDFRFPAG
ncbi:MAG: prepilin peptidase [Alphaproteobacteria bacterium]|nr:prepilin peptidase [Alphaproteobacteria bacterium]